MDIEDLLTPTEVAETVGETAHNIRITYKNKNVKKYKLLVIGALFLRERATVAEIREALAYIKFRREQRKRGKVK